MQTSKCTELEFMKLPRTRWASFSRRTEFGSQMICGQVSRRASIHSVPQSSPHAFLHTTRIQITRDRQMEFSCGVTETRVE